MIAYATDVAARQSAIDERFATASTQGKSLVDSVRALAPYTTRGGSLFDAEARRPGRGRVVFVGRMMDGAEIVVLAHLHLAAWRNGELIDPIALVGP